VICEWCNRDMNTATTCTGTIIEIDGKNYPPVPADEECGDCGVSKGGSHHPGCDIELCPLCGGQRIDCNCPNPRCQKCGRKMEYAGSDDKEDHYECLSCEGQSDRIRKQVYALTSDDLQRCPIWEFCPDEEGVYGQDEATVRPRVDLTVSDPAFGMMMVARADFVANDGTTFRGYCYAESENDLSRIQPVIVTDKGQVMFWYGMVEPNPAELDEAYAKLKKDKATLFPIRFHSSFIANGVNSGMVPAFLFLTSQKHEKKRASGPGFFQNPK
jgi:hypothetical protein